MVSREKMVSRKLFLVPESLERKIQEFRFARRFDTEAQALRYLLQRGLETEGWSETERSEREESTPANGASVKAD